MFNKKGIQERDGKLLKVTQQTGRRASEGDIPSQAQQNGLSTKLYLLTALSLLEDQQ